MEKAQSLAPKRILSGLVVAGMAGALLWALLPKPIDVDIATVSRAPLRVTIDDEGKTRIRDVYVITAPIAGTVRRTPLKAGDTVVKGETIVATIVPPPPAFRDFRTSLELESQVKSCEANVQLADAELRQVTAEFQLAKSDYERAQSLASKGITTQAALQKAETQYKTREASIARAKAALEVRKRELENARIRQLGPEQPLVRQATESACSFDVKSPESGRVLKIVAQSEQTLSIGAPVLEIGDPANLEIVVDLLSAETVKIRPGATATIEAWGGQPLNAHVSTIEPSGFTKISALGIEEQRVKTILTIDDPADVWQRLGHDYRVFVKINAYASANVRLVPLGALFRRDNQWALFAVKGGRAAVLSVTLGQRNATYAEVLDGLADGDQVILHPSDRVIDGVRVRPRTLDN
ncbi:MAG: HlyD family efflux transporter periplasmic adaptor subunit [Hyphomicrobium sp.]|nr:HlyD family efflux transporter periplasmic adaptor subunit [Hyphomicrobium sp.]